MSPYQLKFFQLKQPLICAECATAFLQIPEELVDDAPVHCRECGAYICDWASAKEQRLSGNPESDNANSQLADAKKFTKNRS